MLTILTTTDHQPEVESTIASVNRLHELVTLVTNDGDIQQASKLIIVDNNTIKKSLDWHDTEPPYLIPPVIFSEYHLLAIIFYSLGNHQEAFEYVPQTSILYKNLLAATNIRFGYEINQELYENISVKHNKCVIHHYGSIANRWSLEQLEKNYEDAIKTAENDELKIFTAKHYINLLMDVQKFSKAEALIHSLLNNAISEEAKNALNVQLATAMMQQLQIPFDTKKLETIQDLFQKSIAFYDKHQLYVNSGLLLIDASEIANYQKDFVTSKDLINRALLIFKEEDVPEFLGEAGLRKATLLYTWSKNGHAQYYKPAINAFQDTLKVFKRDTHPQKFADIHHNMALIYSEIPVSAEEKPMWTAFCASSFKEALAFYTKDKYPYENAMISHNYATALINFPEARLHNNLHKALRLFENALQVRTAEQYPFERASTLINQLELYWLLHNETHDDEAQRLDEMRHKINEVKTLVEDIGMLEKVAFHEAKLQSLKTIL
ncbi:hypothetical protein [Ascidiimonas aurantiaca]|uniref:hypothetical protein n=1 Tax=Ascidiimonas aurantiaca TaxID=1685432 RepID=UPI0030EF964E